MFGYKPRKEKPTPPPRNEDCEAVQHSDQMLCDRCALAWDMNDTDPPKCDPINKPAPGDGSDFFEKLLELQQRNPDQIATFRDHLALAAMQGILSGSGVEIKSRDELARLSYKVADAMLKERSR